MRVDHGESKKVVEIMKCQKLEEHMAVYSVVFSAHDKVRMTSTEGGGVLQLWDMTETIWKKDETTANLTRGDTGRR